MQHQRALELHRRLWPWILVGAVAAPVLAYALGGESAFVGGVIVGALMPIWGFLAIRMVQDPEDGRAG